MKILILALSGIGDALMFTPALQFVRKAHPDAEIDALVMFGGVKDIYERNENINNVIHFDFLNGGMFAALKFVLKLRGRYDASINVYPANRKEYNLINFLIGAKKRAGAKYLRRDFRELGFLNNVRITESDSVHNVITNIKLAAALTGDDFTGEPALNFPLIEVDEKFSSKFLTANNISPSDAIIGFHPGCASLKNHIKRRWEPEKFAELGKRLIEKNKANILIFGGPEEKDLKNKILNEINSESAFFVDSKNLAESAALIKKCDVFVSNDSSLMHVAAAMQRKTVAIIGPTNQNYIHPWHTQYSIVTLNLDCSPCFIYSPRPLICTRTDIKFKCIKELNTDMVYSAVLNF